MFKKGKAAGTLLGTKGNRWVLLLVALAVLGVPLLAVGESSEEIPPDLAGKIREIFPHITIDAKDRRVDVESVVCLTEGFLELIACGKDSKEHESVIMVEAKPSHIHAALLLIGAEAGNPAMRKPLNEEATRWAHLPPRGQAVKISLVFPKEGGGTVERPVSDFIAPTKDETGLREAAEIEEKFPDTFLFTGSLFHGEGEERKYIADLSGHVISIATFGDEVFSLSEVHGQENGSLDWQIKPDSLPEIGTKVILRLRPQFAAPAEKE